MTPTFFSSQKEFRAWLQNYHQTKKECLVGFYKAGSGKPSMTWSQSVDQALCFGWIDGIRRSIDKERYSIRFTPRKSTSTWSRINIKKVKALTRARLMRAEGLNAFKRRTAKRSGIYSHEKEARDLPPIFKRQFKMNKPAWDFFNAQAPSYKKVMIHWIATAKQEKTRISRLEKAIKISAQQKRMLF
jgi:uncharacterized protein YdeI (YjbR/CyaY-like superfamily)